MVDFATLGLSFPVITRHDGPGIAWAYFKIESIEALQQLVRQAGLSGFCLVPGPVKPLPAEYTGAPIAYLDLSGLVSVVEYWPEDQVIGVEAGMSLAQLDRLLARQEQWWPCYASDSKTTVAEILSSSDGGCLEHGFGGPRDLVLGAAVALASGDVIKCGGKVVKNVSGYDLKKLFIGSHSWLGIVCSAYLRLFARPSASQTRLWCSDNALSLIAAAKRLIDSGLPLSCLELVDGRVLSTLIQAKRKLEPLAQTWAAGSTLPECVLLIEAHGQESVVGEVLVRAETNISVDCGPSAAVPSHLSRSLWQELSGIKTRSENPCLEIALPFTALAVFFERFWQEAGKPPWQARPGRGRLKLYPGSDQETQRLIEMLGRQASEGNQPLVLSYADCQFERRTVRLPGPDQLACKLKAELKRKFDPQGCLNPLVLP